MILKGISGSITTHEYTADKMYLVVDAYKVKEFTVSSEIDGKVGNRCLTKSCTSNILAITMDETALLDDLRADGMINASTNPKVLSDYLSSLKDGEHLWVEKTAPYIELV